MDLDVINSVSLGSICEGCLSVGRKLSPLYGDESKGFHFILESIDNICPIIQLCWECSAMLRRTLTFREQVKQARDCLVRYMDNICPIIQLCWECSAMLRRTLTFREQVKQARDCLVRYMDNICPIIQLCWECSAMLRRTLTFREQVKQARDCLVRYMLQQTTLTSLSHLNITKNDITHSIIYHKEEETMPSKREDTEKSRERRKKKNTQKVKISNEQEPSIQPVAFIKVEEKAHYDDDVYAEESGVEETVDETHLKTELNSGAFYEVPVKERERKDSFDDSDDEPLNKKAEKNKKEEKPTQKQSRAKREKPAGVVNNARVDNVLRRLHVQSGQLEMVVLSWEQIEEERAKALQSESFTRHEFRCYDCVLGFNHRVKLLDHLRKHEDAGGLRCSVCSVRCKDARALGAHRRRHRVRWRCCVCGCLFSRAAVAADHLSRAHAAPPPEHSCGVCGHVETTLGRLRRHLRSHTPEQPCGLCGKSFGDRASLRTHLFIHRGEKEYACSQCDKRFLFKKALEVHLVTHDAPQYLYCHQCDMTFKNRMSFYQHMKYNLKHIDPAKLKHACSTCGKKFSKSSRLREHELAVHLKCTPVKCVHPGCSFACSSRPVLRTHVRMVHRNARALRNHVCHNCGKTYTTKKTLEAHLRSHSGERPFACALCPARFAHHAALYNHRRVHQSGRSRAAPPVQANADVT